MKPEGDVRGVRRVPLTNTGRVPGSWLCDLNRRWEMSRWLFATRRIHDRIRDRVMGGALEDGPASIVVTETRLVLDPCEPWGAVRRGELVGVVRELLRQTARRRRRIAAASIPDPAMHK
jgi:hypothetical protein